MARRAKAIRERITEKAQVESNECWLWPHVDGKGYTLPGQRTSRAHRVAWEAFVGPIPAGYVIHHQEGCTSRACVNPDHLECVPKTKHDHYRMVCPNCGTQMAKTGVSLGL